MLGIPLSSQLLGFLPVAPVSEPVEIFVGCTSLLVFIHESLPGGSVLY